MKIYLHIGTHKTGTTAIQSFAAENRKLLAEYGVYWPKERLKPHANQHSTLALQMRAGKHDDVKAYLERALREAKSSGAESLFLSGEAFSHLGEANVQRFLAMLDGHDVEVILFFRNVYSYAVSALNQQIKSHEKLLPLSSLVTVTRTHLNYSALLRRWEDALSPQQIKVWNYEDEKKNLLPRFFKRFGIPAAKTNSMLPEEPKASNTSIDLATQLMLSGSGANKTMRAYLDTRDLYSEIFADSRFRFPADDLVAAAICEPDIADLSHPRLEPFRESLLKAPRKMTAPNDDELADYFEKLGQFALRLAKEKRSKRKKGGLLKKIKGKF